MTKYFLGLDLGTSSVKCAALGTDGSFFKVKKVYDEDSPEGWITAAQFCLRSAAAVLAKISAIGLSAQVGTYIVGQGGSRRVIPWSDSARSEELAQLKKAVAPELFLSELSMDHPDLVSYPLPRLMYIKKHIGSGLPVIMPKELILRELTGRTLTDPFSQRGIYDSRRGCYAKRLLSELELEFPLLPVAGCTDLAGQITSAASAACGIAEGTPVYVGCNDFYAGLAGMGVLHEGDVFDLTGTSEHIGFIGERSPVDGMVSSPYFAGYVTYGGTKASGTARDFAQKLFGMDGLDPTQCLKRKPPVFLPYLRGERAPVFDETARGVFFGITDRSSKADLAYSVLEGIAFGLWDIASRLPLPDGNRLICGGGAAGDCVLARLKAELFGRELVVPSETDASALGAAMLAAVGSGTYASLAQAAECCVSYTVTARPSGNIGAVLAQRFDLFRSVYSHLKPDFEKFNK